MTDGVKHEVRVMLLNDSPRPTSCDITDGESPNMVTLMPLEVSQKS